jgi:hypothetical protein
VSLSVLLLVSVLLSVLVSVPVVVPHLLATACVFVYVQVHCHKLYAHQGCGKGAAGAADAGACGSTHQAAKSKCLLRLTTMRQHTPGSSKERVPAQAGTAIAAHNRHQQQAWLCPG